MHVKMPTKTMNILTFMRKILDLMLSEVENEILFIIHSLKWSDGVDFELGMASKLCFVSLLQKTYGTCFPGKKNTRDFH